jgi:hypothetical protein
MATEQEPATFALSVQKRLLVVSEIEEGVAALKLQQHPTIQVLQLILNNYVTKGLPCQTELPLQVNDPHRPNRAIIVQLFNDSRRKDQVFIKALESQTPAESDMARPSIVQIP